MALERVLADREMASSARRSRLLRHLVEETLAGRAERLKGMSIAIDVFGRTPDFDQQTDAVVRSEARRLRQALASYYVGAGADDPVRISVPKGGYVPLFERGPSAAVPAPGTGAVPDPDPETETETGTETGADEGASGPAAAAGRPGAVHLPRPRPMAALAAAALLVAVLAGTTVVRWQGGGAVEAPVAHPPSVLVRPFEAAGSAADIETLARGITAQLIADLMRFPDFRLYSPSGGTGEEEAAARSRAAVDYVIGGIVRGDGESLSVVVRLVDAADGRVIWSEAYARPLEPGALVAMQGDISGEIAAEIGQPYGPVRSAVARMVEDAEGARMSSFSCVLSAYTYRHANRSDLYAPVRACLEEAVVHDPDYAEAWAMLAYVTLDGGRFGYEAGTAAERQAAYAAARTAAARALALEPESVQGTKALSLVEHYAGRYGPSVELAREALRLNPNDPDTLAHLGWRLSVRGEFEDGIPYLERAIERSVSPPAWYFQPIAVERLMAGDMEGMLVAAERAAVDGSSVSDALLAIAHANLGRKEEARAGLERMARRWPLLAQDPAAAFALHHLREDLVAAIVDGLETAGWHPPEGAETARR